MMENFTFQPCDELKDLILQLYRKLTSGGVREYAGQLYSRQDGALLIGSQPEDRHEDYAAILGFYQAAGEVVEEVQVDEITARAEGASGWVFDRVIARLPDGLEVPVRHTYVFHREGGAWKVVHAHISVAILDKDLGRVFRLKKREANEDLGAQ